MALFDSALGAMGSLLKQGGAADAGQLVTVVNELLKQTGGLAGLLQKFQAGGLGQIAASWIGKGDNLPVSADQLTQVLGHPLIAGLASKIGLDTGLVASLLAKGLPSVVDQMTPEGSIPANGGQFDLGQATQVLGKFFGKG
ncbi:MAG: DUF937 domain-containing protein [Burkholderiales bacterium]|nr:DUF937 domain-containing protein [Burkholderiales bacterium]